MSEFLQQYAYGGQQRPPAPGSASPEAGQSGRLSAMQKGTGVLAGLATIGAGASEARSLQRQAGDEILAGAQELTQAERDTNQIRRAALQNDAMRRVAFAASGVDTGSESVQVLGREDARRAEDAQADRMFTGMRDAARRRQYANLLARRAAETFGSSLIAGGTQIASSFAPGG